MADQRPQGRHVPFGVTPLGEAAGLELAELDLTAGLLEGIHAPAGCPIVAHCAFPGVETSATGAGLRDASEVDVTERDR
jgi:hypothetical protein